jgi:hypothetical protein
MAGVEAISNQNVAEAAQSGAAEDLSVDSMTESLPQEMQDMLAMQQAVQNETFKLNTASNIMKTKHEGKMAVARNLKA